MKKHAKNRTKVFFAELFRGLFAVRTYLKSKQKLPPIVGNEVIGHADILWNKGRWQRNYPTLWNMWKRGKDWRQNKYFHGIPALLFIIVVLTGAISWFSLHAEIAKFYPSACLGGWQNPKNAEGVPELSSDADVSEFSDTNSAVLSGAASQIFCGSFQGEIPEDAEMKTLLVKFSWTLGERTTEQSNGGAREQEDNGTTTEQANDETMEQSNQNNSSIVVVSSGDTASSSVQEILDAPADAAIEIHLEDTPELIVPAPTETPSLGGGTSDKGQETKVQEQEASDTKQQNDGATESATIEAIPASVPEIPDVPPPLPPADTPPPTEPAPVSFFDRLFQHVFAEEMTVVTSTPEQVSDGVIEPVSNGTTTENNGTKEQPNTGTTTKEASITPIQTPEIGTVTEQTNERLTEPTVNSSPASPEFLEVLYTLDGAEWHSLGKVSKMGWKAEFAIPVSEWDDISKLQISVQSLPSIDEPPKVYLDGLWLEAEYQNSVPEEVAAAGSGTFSSVANVTGPISFFSTEIVNGTEAYVLTLNNPGEVPDYKYEFTSAGVRLLLKHGAGWKELMSGVNPIPEYRTSNNGTTTGQWQAYPLSPLLSALGTYSGWRQDNTSGELRMIREFQTEENGTQEIFTEEWAIPESAEELGSKGPKATYKMTKNAVASLSWRLRLAYNGIKDIQRDRADIKDEDNYPIRFRQYRDFSIDVDDFDVAEAKNGKAKHVFSEKIGAAEAVFFPEGTTGERIVDPTTVTTGVSTGWGSNKTRAVFYTGARYWLLYTNADGNIYYKSSTDNSTWTATSTLITSMSKTDIDFDTFLVDNTKFDIGYPDSARDPRAVTVTVGGSSLATSTASAAAAATTCNTISIARTPFANRIFLGCRANASRLEIYSADQTGDANGVSTWTTEIGGTTEANVVSQVSMAPYGASDQVLMLYERDGLAADDCIWSRAIKRSGGAGTATTVNCSAGTQFASDAFGNLARTASSTFSLAYSDTKGTVALREAVWNGNTSTWSTTTSIATGFIKSPSLFHDTVTGDLYAFASTSASVVYYKKTAGSWGSAITADDSEGTSRNLSLPVTQMQMMFPPEQTFLPWAYRTTNGANFDLKVGTLGLHGTTTQRAYIFLNDDGNGSATTTDSYTKAHGAATSTSITGVKIGERLIARIQVDNITAGTSTKMYRLQWENNTDASGTWSDLSTTTAIRWSLSQKGALKGRPGEAPLATAQLGAAGACVTAGTTYQAGRFVSGNATSSVISLGPSKCTELAFAIETSGATLGKTYRLRLVNGVSGLPFDQSPLNGAYAQYPTFTIESARTLTYSKESRGSYATTTLDSLNNIGHSPSIAIGIDGLPVISYHDFTVADLKFAKCNDISCSSFTVSTLDSSDGAGQDTSIAIGIDGFPVISYQNITTFELKFAKCNDISCTSAATSTIDSLSNYGVYTSIAIGIDGFPVIGYQDADLGLKVAKCNNISCSSSDISFIDASYAQTGYYPSLAIGIDGFPAISYQDLVTGDLKFAKCNNASCTSAATSTLDSFNNTGYTTALAIGADGYPIVSYYDTTVGDLKFAKCNDISCVSAATSTLDSLNNTGYSTSLAIGIDGFPVISYQDQNATGALRFAKCNNIGCTSAATSTIDSLDTPGDYSSIAIGIDGYPVISYHDQTTTALRFAKCGNSSCSAATSLLANLPANAQSYDTYLDDSGYNNVATSDNAYDSLSSATSSRLAYNFKKASSTNTDQITVTWEGQVSVSTTTTLQIYNNSSGLWETLQANTSPTANSDFTLTGNVSGTAYYDGSNIVTTRAVTGTTTKATVMKTDQVSIGFSVVAPTLTQRAYIFLNDDGNGTATTTDTYTRAHSAATSSSISNVKKGERLIARIQIDNTGFATSTNQYRLQYDKNDNTWVDVATTTEIRTSLSQKGALWGRPDGVPLPTRQVTESCNASAPTYQEGRFVSGTATSTTFSIGPARCTEIAYAFETSGATLGQLYRLRVVSASTTIALNSYAVYPTFTIESARTLTYSKEARGTYATSSLDISGSVGQSTSLTIGIDGFPVLASHSSDGFFRFAKCNDPSCASVTKSTIDSSGTPGLDSSIAIGVDGFPVMSYYDLTSKHLKFAKCNDIGCTSPAVSTLDTSTSDTGLSTSLAIGSDGYPVISYFDFTLSSLVFVKCKDISCASLSTSTLASANDNGRSTSITIGIDGYPIIVYTPLGSGRLSMIKCNDASCSTYATPDIDTVCNGNCSDPAVAVGTDGYPVVSYFYNNGGYILKFAKCNNAACTSVTTSTLDSASDVGRYTSLQIGIDGYPVISYYRTTSGDLKFAKCNNIGCTSFMLSTLDEGDDIGQTTSMAIGVDGFPVIGYYRVTGSDLGFLKCNSIDCASGASSTANLPANAQSYDTYLDDVGYSNVASSDNTYDSLSAATSSRLAYNFKKASSTNTDAITVTWEGQVSVSTTTTLQIYNNSSGLWETLQTNTSPTANSDFTLTGNVSGTAYYDGSNIVTTRAVTGTTTKFTTLKTDQITVAFSAAVSLTLLVDTNVFGTLTPGTYKMATSTINVTTTNSTGYYVTMYGNNQGSNAASTTLYLSPTTYATNIADQTEWVPGSATTSAGNAVARASLDSSGQVLAFRVMSASGSVPFLSTAWWGNSDADGTALWAGIASSTIQRQIGNSSVSAPSGVLSTVQYYLDTPVTQPTGDYTGDITFTAVANP